MAPKPEETFSPTGVLYENDEVIITEKIPEKSTTTTGKQEIIWSNLIIQIVIHIFALWGLVRIFTSAKLTTTIYGFIIYEISMMGTMAGVHRLWAHRTYKAKLPLKLLLAVFATLAAQKSIIDWARDHRVHHRYSDTDADPHNAKRGFFYAHFGWQFMKKHPEVIKKGTSVDFSDLFADPILSFQHKHYWLLQFTSYLLPAFIPMLLWNETFFNGFCINWLRYELGIHSTFSINSFSHLMGHKPYDKYIGPTENLFVSIISHGEGWHNYHHTFPWDYRAGEKGQWNPALYFINFFAKIGWAYDLKKANAGSVENRLKKTGDGSRQ
ncbi:unnamed protein product [Ceutorhynchus assimilis]|uniref:Fatty acid desaturase domain-containing protein n=1 Tax=Ceutorhynchus assimilis TaxID=467358 RepID=A0A9P0DJK1_9CUCU|nr:unnamed protein product [Ceutorhynchus assimilis]